MAGIDSEAQARFREAYGRALTALRLGQAASAERQLRAIQAAAPGEVNSLRLLGLALLVQDKVPEAIGALEKAVAAAPGFPQARTDLARAYRQAGRLDAALAAARAALAAAPSLGGAWYALGDIQAELGECTEANVAYARGQLADPKAARIQEAGAAFERGERREAEVVFREILKEDASHVGALCGLAAVSIGVGAAKDAEQLLRHALRQVAHLPLAWRGLSQALLEAGRLDEAEQAIRHALKVEPDNPHSWVMLGSVCNRLLRNDEALSAYGEAARLNPAQVRHRLSQGHVLKTVGRRAECERAYVDCLERDPAFGEAWWSLADLKNYLFSDDQVGAMQALLATGSADDANLALVHFALGRALEQRRAFHEAFAHYSEGNALRRRVAPFDIAAFENKCRRIAAICDRDFFAERRGAGCPDPGPIFVVGLPRSGSTLVEQILASHSQVEGMMELPNILTIVRELEQQDGGSDRYPECLPNVSRDQFVALGRRYLAETRPLRAGRARFIDKMPNNFSHIGLVHAILPNATIIDVRRHPLDACLSTFKQYFAAGQTFSYSLEDLGRYYRSYLALMDHWDAVLSGRVLHVAYEELVRDPEAGIRRLLAHCGLEFEAACLSFHETRRAVRTASSEQVRQPLYSSGIGHWRHFAAELEPLRHSLGECLARFEETA